MGNKRVAGTIMLHLEDGKKKFLVHSIGDTVEFALTDFSQEKTGLANMLDFLKKTVHVDVTAINLLELTNTHIDHENVPLFVFETEQVSRMNELADDYYWEGPDKLRAVLGAYEVEGVPFF